MIVIPQMLENQIALLKKCAEFYANEKNYIQSLSNEMSQIDLDEGFVAKETLKTIKILEDQNQKISDEFEKISEATNMPTIESISEEVKKIMNQ